MKKTFSALMLMAAATYAAEHPTAKISNGQIRAVLAIPAQPDSYYHGTRFDWSGIVEKLEFQGHTYFQPFYERFDANVRDVYLKEGVVAGPISAVSGPAEEFGAEDGSLGYASASPGGTFIKIGVGVLRKPDEPKYDHYRQYDIADPGKWNIRKHPDGIEFIQEINDPGSGYSFVYRKTVRLVKGKPVMRIEHSIKNTGRTIAGNVYNHNFFVIDQQATGPDFSIRFPFQVQAVREMSGLASVRDKDVQYLKTLGNGDTAATELRGYGSDSKDYQITVENRKTGAGVRVTGDQPLSRVYLWSVKTTLCPEAYVDLNIAKGQEFKWNISYEFYVTK